MTAHKVFFCATTLAAFFCIAQLAPAQTLTTLASFNLTNGDDPVYGSLVQGSDGSFYGTTLYGGEVNSDLCGSLGCGTVFKLTPDGTLTALYSFCSLGDCTDGFYPVAELVEGRDGNFYGTTSAGGSYSGRYCNGRGCGTVFKITPSGTLTTLYSFCSQGGTSCPDGREPVAPLVQGSDGNLYGTTTYGGTNCSGGGGCGAVFKITSTGTLTTLYSFCAQGGINCTDGEYPYAALVQGSDGNFYGTTSAGGTGNFCGGYCGTVFKITTTGALTTLYDFCATGQPTCTDGYEPLAGLVQATDGNFYGTTEGGGTTNSRLCLNRACGTVFKITPTGTLTTVYNFCSETNCADGYMPYAGLVQGSDGNFYGTTWAGGNPGCSGFGCGTAFKLTPSGALTTLYLFCSQQNCTDGNSPSGTLVQLSNGNLYGTTGLGVGDGTVFSLSLGAPSTFSVIHNFTGGPDGGQPAAGVTLDPSGILYGTAFYGGNFNNCASGCGVVYNLKLHGSSWTLNPLYMFNGPGDGANPYYGAVTIGPDGTLYGTTSSGGIGESGTVFNVHARPAACASIICPYLDTTVHQFGSGNDGFTPTSGVIFDAAGNLYGTTYRGGASGNGTVWQATRSGQNWTESVIYNFTGTSDGVNPAGTLTMDSAGNLYGTTYGGGANGWGTVFKLTNSGSGWTKTILYNFQNANDGRAPVGGVVFDQAGNIYGGTAFGGQNGGGTVYQLSPSGGGYTINVLYGFSGVAGPYNNLTLDASGNLYGTTYRDGADLAGSVFKLTQSGGNWTLTDLHDFTNGSDGGYPTSSVAIDAHGDVFGTASSGGTGNQGVVFEITP